jgi:hypothetical protein
MMENPDTYFPDNTYLFGDSAYPLSLYLIIPYSQAEARADPSKRNYNLVFSGMCGTIERAFGQLVKRWQFLLQYLYLTDNERITETITCCVILHNICLEMHDAVNEESDDYSPTHEDNFHEESSRASNLRRDARTEGVNLRESLRAITDSM